MSFSTNYIDYTNFYWWTTVKSNLKTAIKNRCTQLPVAVQVTGKHHEKPLPEKRGQAVPAELNELFKIHSYSSDFKNRSR